MRRRILPLVSNLREADPNEQSLVHAGDGEPGLAVNQVSSEYDLVGSNPSAPTGKMLHGLQISQDHVASRDDGER